MSEDFGIDLQLDEAAEARIAHADFLNSVKDWAVEMGEIMDPFVEVMKVLVSPNPDPDDFKQIQVAFPIGLRLAVKQLNIMYDLMQTEANKILGAPFAMHEEHHPNCDGTKQPCGHQDHWAN